MIPGETELAAISPDESLSQFTSNGVHVAGHCHLPHTEGLTNR